MRNSMAKGGQEGFSRSKVVLFPKSPSIPLFHAVSHFVLTMRTVLCFSTKWEVILRSQFFTSGVKYINPKSNPVLKSLDQAVVRCSWRLGGETVFCSFNVLSHPRPPG